MRQYDMTVVDYTSNIKDICESLASIDVNVDEGEMVQIYLGGLTSKFGAFRTALCTRETTPSFFDLARKSVNEYARQQQDVVQGRGESAPNRGGRREQGRRHSGDADNNSGPSGSRGSRGGAENRPGKPAAECWYCGKKGHKDSGCSKKRADSEKIGSGSRFGRTIQGNWKRSHYAEGSQGSEKVGKGPVSVIRREANSMKKTTPKSDEVWYVDSEASNHMMSHKE